MKIQWSVFYVLFLTALAGCGSEQFGTVPQTETSNPDGLTAYQQLSCSTYTLIKPKVDILYVVDNSASSYYLSDDIKNAVKGTVDTISSQFDYRVVGIPLIADATPYDDYQIMTNSSDPLDSAANSRKVISSSELTFFSNPGTGGSSEPGLLRTIQFMNQHSAPAGSINSTKLFRQNAYHIVVLISNGRDTDVESDPFGTGQTQINQTVYNSRLSSFNALKTQLSSQGLRFFSVSALQHNCNPGWRASRLSYMKMANDLYSASGATDNNLFKDSYDLCVGGLSYIFTGVNNSIQQVVQPHSYKYWPITFLENNEEIVSISDIQVYKVSNGSAPALMPSSSWTYRRIPGGTNTRILPTVGEFNSGSHFVEFNSSSYVTYPDCVQVKSISRTEYFGYVVLPREPRPDSISLRINGAVVPQSSTAGWTYVGHRMNQNIKIPYPAAGDELPAVNKSGYMLQLNGVRYKSGDSVEVNYLPQGV